MKCKNNCLAQINSRECPDETGCLIFSDNEQIEFADGDIGCRLTRTQIEKKLNKRARVLQSTEKSHALNKIVHDTRQADATIALLMTILDMMERESDKRYYWRNGKTHFSPERLQYTFSCEDFRDMFPLVATDVNDAATAGLISIEEGSDGITLTVTPYGLRWLSDLINIEIKGAKKQSKKAFQKDEIDLLLEALLEKEEKRRR